MKRRFFAAAAAALVALAVVMVTAGFGAISIASADRGYHDSDWRPCGSCNGAPSTGTVVGQNPDGSVWVINQWNQVVFAQDPPPPPGVRYQARFNRDGWFDCWVILPPCRWRC
jgi:streptogramin lyase